MIKLKTKWFEKWSKKNKIANSELILTLSNLISNKSTESLGSGLFKVRLARKGEGKSGGFRTFVIFKTDIVSIFVLGIAKNERENISRNKLGILKKMSKEILKLNKLGLEDLRNNKNFMEINEE